MTEYTLITDQLPEKGKNIIGIDDQGEEKYCFRCACSNPNCTEWRCSLTGFDLMVNIVKWVYDEEERLLKKIDLNELLNGL